MSAENIQKAMQMTERQMVEYCKRDVELLERVHNRLAEFVPAKTHAGVVMGRDKWTCPHDGSENVKVVKTRITAAGAVQYQMQCKDCGAFFTISEAAHKQYQEAKKPK